MQDSPSDHFALSAVVWRRPARSRWLDASWSLLGTLPGLTPEALEQAGQGGELIRLPDMRLNLYRQHCEAYHLNLVSEQPKIYLVCSESGGTLSPILLTVDFDEAASFMETDELVLDAPLADVLCAWLERFVVAHYVPARRKKRKRTQWHEQDGSGS